MKRLIMWVGVAFCIGAFAGTSTMSFPYGSSMSIRHEMRTAVDVEGSCQVPAVGGGMPAVDTVATSYADVSDMDAEPDASWNELSERVGGCQAALAIRRKGDGTNVWMGRTADGWEELTGVAAASGAWLLKIDLDYTLGAASRKVRYSVRKKNEAEYQVLSSASSGLTWLANGRADVAQIKKCRFDGVGGVASATVESGQRQGYAETATVEDYRMDYSGVTLDVAVGETWGVDTLVATVKDADGNEKGEVRKALSDAQDGKVRLDLSAYTKSGESYVYDLKLTGEYNGTPMTCEKGESQVDLFSMVDWFGFVNSSLVKASVQGLTISGGVLSATDSNVKGSLIPNASETESSPTAVETTLSVPGAISYWNLSALPVVGSQGALVMARFGGSVGRSWAVWSATANDWVAVSGTGVGTGNGSYEVRAEFDEISSVRSVRYSVKVGSDYVVLKDGQANEWFALPAEATRLNRVSLSGAGGITSLEASYKALGPVPEVSVKDGKIELTSNTELDLSKSSLETDRGYPVQNPPGKKFHLRWKDAKSGDATTKWAKVENGQLKAVAGAPANGLDSFESHVLGLDPEDVQSRPLIAAEQNAEPDTLVLKLPTVRQRDPSETGVAVRYCLVTSDDTSFATETTAQEVTNVLAGEGPTFTADLPSSGGKVRYYRVKIVMEK